MQPPGPIPSQRRVEATKQFAPREVRSFEVEHVNSCWHLDFHIPLRGHEMTEIEIVIAAAGGERQADVFTAHWGDILLATSRTPFFDI